MAGCLNITLGIGTTEIALVPKVFPSHDFSKSPHLPPCPNIFLQSVKKQALPLCGFQRFRRFTPNVRLQ